MDKISILELEEIQQICACWLFHSLGEIPVQSEKEITELIQACEAIVSTLIPIQKVEVRDRGKDERFKKAFEQANQTLKEKIAQYLVYCNDFNYVQALVENATEALRSAATVSELNKVEEAYIRLLNKKIRNEKILREYHLQRNYRRIQKAKSLLIEGENGMGITDKLHFISEFNLYKTFRKYTGLTTKGFLHVYRQVMFQIEN